MRLGDQYYFKGENAEFRKKLFKRHKNKVNILDKMTYCNKKKI